VVCCDAAENDPGSVNNISIFRVFVKALQQSFTLPEHTVRMTSGQNLVSHCPRTFQGFFFNLFARCVSVL
jgi:hypothetical protein